MNALITVSPGPVDSYGHAEGYIFYRRTVFPCFWQTGGGTI
ncbi:hypothetical protein BACCAP_04014 [Pseudoflavonifractor capillosus ATCC 29799]|uniref:Uncharacterized protein n=1 Tax=Pseudoflavonifractor capillosus ATCC 29799 TaxID=411467 RepID=A6P0K3_9FIRM|nr:hypothetical protein BACCAP_04014 [Pseudoflavonifractor capillosus ATCC 29799]